MKSMLKRSTLLGTFVCLVLGASAFAQEKMPKQEPNKELKQEQKQEAKQEPKQEPKQEMKDDSGLQAKIRAMLRSGYTRPGYPPDPNDKVQAALDPNNKGQMIGASIYFAVFKLSDVEAVEGLMDRVNDHFVPGRSFANSVSPSFDRKAKYLYAYQIVNDRGLNPTDGDLTRFDNNINTADITSWALQLKVDPRYITSWGYFHDLGFNARVRDDVKKVPLTMAVSANPAIVNQLPVKRFEQRSPAHSFRDLDLGKSNLNLQNSPAHASLLKRLLDRVANWMSGMNKVASQGGIVPEFVQIIYNDYYDEVRNDQYIGDTLFRVDFNPKDPVEVGEFSLAFGFTSDLPPTDAPVRIRGLMPDALKGKAKGGAALEGALDKVALFDEFVALAAQDAAAAGEGTAVAVGTVPTPTPPETPASPTATTGLTGGGGSGGAGFAAPFLPLPGSFLGTARAPASAGAGATSNGQGSNQQAQAQRQAQNQNQQSPTTINFNATLINQQAQAQAQAQLQFQIQAQQQNQHQRNNNHQHNNNHHHDHHVVPEPSTIIAGLLGMPALYFFRRRTQAQSSPAVC